MFIQYSLFCLSTAIFYYRGNRRKDKNGAEIVTPLFLGLLTVLIPAV